MVVAEIEQIEQIADGRAVLRYVGIVLIGARIGEGMREPSPKKSSGWM
jgi:hypothetical protein